MLHLISMVISCEMDSARRFIETFLDLDTNRLLLADLALFNVISIDNQYDFDPKGKLARSLRHSVFQASSPNVIRALFL